MPEALRNQHPPIPQPDQRPLVKVGELRGYREAAGLSQDEVAEALGVTRQAVSKWEASDDPGEHKPKLMGLLGWRDPYPNAPLRPDLRRKYFDEVHGPICRRYKPKVAIIGAGKPPEEKKTPHAGRP